MSSSSVAPAVPANAAGYRVLFVDLDGSLLATDVTMESFFRAVKAQPAVLLEAPVWLLRGGRPLMKRRLLEIAPAAETTWPYCQEVVALLRKHKQDGCHLVLATASDRQIAQRVADDLGLFDAVLATDGATNLKGPNKLIAIEAYCQEHGFDSFAYLGDSPADLPIWRKAAMAFAVAPGTVLKRRIDALGVPTQTVAANPTRWKDLVRALRPHQWSKNVLIFLPTFLAHDLSPLRILHALMGFLSFSACASSVYLVNDLLDLETDRRHPTKRHRPIPAGKIRLSTVALAVPILTALAFVLAMGTATWRFCAILLLYLGASGLYSFWLKRKAVIDVFLLSGLYILRVQAGGDAAGVPVSEWMLEFSLFFFLSLAFAKRFIELDRLELASDTHHTGRGYQSVDVPTIFTLGPASGYIAALVFALYLSSPQVALLYTRPKILWLLCPILLFWITRLWLLARRKELHDDPVVFALKDRMSLVLGVLSAAVVMLAWLLGAPTFVKPEPVVLSGWGNYPRESCFAEHVETSSGLRQAILSGKQTSYIARGLGRAYGDSSLNRDQGVLVQTGMNRMLAFDAENGVLECEAGVSLSEIIDVFLPRGWFLPTTPGTKAVTIGGAIAADIHGKNHHRDGSFGRFVLDLRLLLATGEEVRCSPQERPELFWATVGGMGLTGCITTARIQLVRVPSAFVAVNFRKTRDLDETLEVFSNEDQKYRYSVAWIDCLARGDSLGRSVVMLAEHAAVDQLPTRHRSTPLTLPRKFPLAVPFNLPGMAMAPWSMRVFNKLYYGVHKDELKIVDYNSFFYPLDRIERWNRIYGKRGFVQYQAWFPRETSRRGLVELLQRISASQKASFLAVLKSSGAASGGLLSYLQPGHTLALDFANTGADLRELCRQLDQILLAHGGRLYLAKDSLMSAECFQAMYPRLAEFRAVKAAVDPNCRFNSSQARRVGIVEHCHA